MSGDSLEGRMECWVVDLGANVDYDASHGLQKSLVARRADNRIPNVLLLLEHSHVITIGRDGQEMDKYLKLPAAELERRGIVIRAVERGGLATYHGPGQLVAYPILRLPSAENIVRATKQFSDAIKRVAHATIAEYLPVSDLTISPGGKSGVWYKDRKLASSGIVVEQSWVGWHGVAINANTDLSYFGYIDPCGLPSDVMTSLQAVLGRPVDMAELKQKLVGHFAEEFKLELRHVAATALQE